MHILRRLALISLDSEVVRAQGFIEAEIDREVILLCIDSGFCYGLNAIGSEIWALIAAPVRVVDICEVMFQKYEVERQTCEMQVLDLLEELRSEGLVRVVE